MPKVNRCFVSLIRIFLHFADYMHSRHRNLQFHKVLTLSTLVAAAYSLQKVTLRQPGKRFVPAVIGCNLEKDLL